MVTILFTMICLTREQAKLHKVKVYNLGSKDCTRCGSAIRYVSTKSCVDCQKTRVKEWDKRNPDRARESCRKSVALWRKNNLNKAREAWTLWRKNNPDRAREINRKAVKAFWKNNPDKSAVNGATRRALKVAAAVALTKAEKRELRLIYRQCSKLNKRDGKATWHVDHIIPLAKGGIHHPLNLRVILATENSCKSDTLDWKLISLELLQIHARHGKFCTYG